MPDDLSLGSAPEERLQKAQGQLNALVLGMLAYLKAHDLAADEWMAFLGGRLAQGWDPELTAVEFIREEATFLISIGCDLRSLSGDRSQAEATFRSWPPDADWTSEGFLSFWELSQEEVDVIWDMYAPVADRLGLDYRWRRAGDQVTLTFTRRKQ
jgi:hypothetical protein